MLHNHLESILQHKLPGPTQWWARECLTGVGPLEGAKALICSQFLWRSYSHWGLCPSVRWIWGPYTQASDATGLGGT